MKLECSEVSGGGACVAGVEDEVAAHGKSCAFFFGFVGFQFADKFSIGAGTVGGDHIFGNENDCVCPGEARADALC